MVSILQPRQLSSSLVRSISVLAWGSNACGQCGVCPQNSKLFLVEPEEVQTLSQLPIAQLDAGLIHTGAVLETGEVMMWGDGRAGKLGLGSGESMGVPTTLESLSSRTQIRRISLGQSHSLFLDTDGQLWSCGENKQGQCGLGTPLQVIAQQHRGEWTMAINQVKSQGQQQLAVNGQGQGQSQAESTVPWNTVQYYGQWLKPFIDHQHKHDELKGAFDLLKDMKGELRRADSMVVESAALGQQSWNSSMADLGVAPGQCLTPVRIGRDLHILEGKGEGLSDEVVIDIGASKYFSASTTASGQVWAFGGGFNGELGQTSDTWMTSPKLVGGQIQRSMAINGGALQIATGGTYCLCLTANGKVLMWGRPPGIKPNKKSTIAPGEAVVLDIPVPVKMIAAGLQHALVSDGETVWQIGKVGDETSKEQEVASWQCPLEILKQQDESIKQICAGSFSSAVVTGSGQLYMWGRLMERSKARELMENASYPQPHHAKLPSIEEISWEWPGLYSKTPQLVTGLSNIRQIALGGMHAVVTVD